MMLDFRHILNNVQGRDVVAMLLIVGLFILKLVGMNGYVDATMAIVVGYYFGKRSDEEKIILQNGTLRKKDKHP